MWPCIRISSPRGISVLQSRKTLVQTPQKRGEINLKARWKVCLLNEASGSRVGSEIRDVVRFPDFAGCFSNKCQGIFASFIQRYSRGSEKIPMRSGNRENYCNFDSLFADTCMLLITLLRPIYQMASSYTRGLDSKTRGW